MCGDAERDVEGHVVSRSILTDRYVSVAIQLGIYGDGMRLCPGQLESLRDIYLGRALGGHSVDVRTISGTG